MSPDKWSDKQATRRLADIVSAVPGWGAGTQSTTIAGISAYAVDMRIIQRLTRDVLRAVNAKPPHPMFGDEGDRDDARQCAAEALAWAESWAAWRNACDWAASQRIDYLAPIPTPESPCSP